MCTSQQEANPRPIVRCIQPLASISSSSRLCKSFAGSMIGETCAMRSCGKSCYCISNTICITWVDFPVPVDPSMIVTGNCFTEVLICSEAISAASRFPASCNCWVYLLVIDSPVSGDQVLAHATAGGHAMASSVGNARKRRPPDREASGT